MPILTATGLKTLTLATADLREASFIHPADAGYGYYQLYHTEAAELACSLLGIDQEFARPVALGLSGRWNDMLDWAGDFPGRQPTITIPEDFQFPSHEPTP